MSRLPCRVRAAWIAARFLLALTLTAALLAAVLLSGVLYPSDATDYEGTTPMTELDPGGA